MYAPLGTELLLFVNYSPLRCDSVHSAGWVSTFLGRGSAQTLPTDQSWSLWCEFTSFQFCGSLPLTFPSISQPFIFLINICPQCFFKYVLKDALHEYTVLSAVSSFSNTCPVWCTCDILMFPLHVACATYLSYKSFISRSVHKRYFL